MVFGPSHRLWANEDGQSKVHIKKLDSFFFFRKKFSKFRSPEKLKIKRNLDALFLLSYNKCTVQIYKIFLTPKIIWVIYFETVEHETKR